MQVPRRQFLASAISATVAAGYGRSATAQHKQPSYEELDEALAKKVLHVDEATSAVVIQSIELLRNGNHFLVRVRSRDGAEGMSVANASRLRETYPIFLNRVAPFFIGKDARLFESLIPELYRFRSNYKLQGIALWSCLTALEIAVLDMLGKITRKSIGQMLGGVKRTEIAVYRASGNRGNQPAEEIEYLKKLLAETGADAVKFRLGGRMSNNADSLPGRTETLIPLVRQELGADITLYADSNSSYDAANAIRIGRLMEQHNYAFFEEPCRFDHLWETKQVADALSIPVAGGEQEFSMRRFRWAIHQRAVDIVQPDLHYFGGYIRCMKVANMAATAGMPCTLHMSGSGLGYVDVCHFASCVADPGKHQEYKGQSNIPMHCDTSDLKCTGGLVRVPTGPGSGIEIDPAFVKQARQVKTI